MQEQVHRDDVATTPILRLFPELLRHIFFENTRLGHPHPLRTAQSSSQVCRQWREILLSSSSLWGRLVVVDQLGFTKADDPWRNEVLTRCGSALLWIQGDVTFADHKIFVSFLEKHRERVERVDIIEGDRNSITWHYALHIMRWKGLEYTAPNLKAFTLTGPLRLRRSVSQSDPHITHFLFKDGAPNLREISIPDVKFDIRSPWLSNIRTISLSPVFSIEEMFQLLEATPLLTNLDISMRPAGESSQPLERGQPRISLPLLETFSLSAYFDVALPFFEFLDFPDSCIPAINLEDSINWYGLHFGDPDVLEKELETATIIRDRIVRLMQKHLPLRKLTHMTISISWQQEMSSRFLISGHDGMGISTTVSIGDELDSLPRILDSEELSIFDQWQLPSVKELTLYIVRDGPLPPSSRLALVPSFSLSLTTLVADEDTLEFILDIKSTTPECVPFPCLEVLRLTLKPVSEWESSLIGYHPELLLDFFQWQMTGGSPISILDLSQIPFHSLNNMEYLDNVPRLKTVRWIFPATGPSEYECGIGDPVDLRFDEIWKSYCNRMQESKSKVRFS